MPPGPTPKLARGRLAQFPAFLALSAEAFGFTGDLWTTHRVAAVIERVFGVRYHPTHAVRSSTQAASATNPPVQIRTPIS